MASVRIETGAFPSAEGIEEGYDLDKVVGKWSAVAYLDFERDCSWLVKIIDETNRLRLWEKSCGGFKFPDAATFLQKQVLLDFDMTIDQAQSVIDAILKNRPDLAQEKLKEAGKIAREKAVEEAMGNPLAEHGEIGRGRDRGSNTTSIDRGQTYTLRRLARDRPDLLDRVSAGDLSPNRAAIEAGFRKPTWIMPRDLTALGQAIKRRLSPAEFQEFQRVISAL